MNALLGEVDPFEAIGDSIVPKLLKELVHVLSLSLMLLFNASMKQGCWPRNWKTASVTP